MDNLLKDMGKRIFDPEETTEYDPGNSGRAGSMSHHRPSPPQNWDKRLCGGNNPQSLRCTQHQHRVLVARHHHRNRFLPSHGEDFHTNAQAIQAF